MMAYHVFESGSAKWIYINESDGRPKYTSNELQATVFSLLELRSAHDFFGDFAIYKRTLHAVPIGSNVSPGDCPTVADYLRKKRENVDDAN